MKGQPVPTFALSAADPIAPFLVSIYSSMLTGDVEAASAKFAAMIDRAASRYMAAPDIHHAEIAIDHAMAMFAWCNANGDLCR